MQRAALTFTNNSACYFIAGIAGRLRGEIVPVFMNDQRAPDDIGDFQKTVVKSHEAVAVAVQDRRQVAEMIGMDGACRIVVHSGVFKRIAAVAVFMDVHSEKTGREGSCVGQVDQLYLHYGTGSPSRGIEVCYAYQIRIEMTAADRGAGQRRVRGNHS